MTDAVCPSAWPSVLSRFNEFMEIQRNTQRGIYEERFDTIRSDTQKSIGELKDERNSIAEDLCTAMDHLAIFQEDSLSLASEKKRLIESVDNLRNEFCKANAAHETLLSLEKQSAQKAEEKELSLKLRLDNLKNQRRELEDTRKDLLNFVNLRNKVCSAGGSGGDLVGVVKK